VQDSDRQHAIGGRVEASAKTSTGSWAPGMTW
jgi:hypothetical protein